MTRPTIKDIAAEAVEAYTPLREAAKAEVMNRIAPQYGLDPDVLEDWLDENAEAEGLDW